MFSKKATQSWAFPSYNHIIHAMLSLYMVCEYKSNVLTTWRIKFETFPFLLTLSGVLCLSAQNMFMKHSFHELALSYSISENIYLSRVISSFLQYRWNEDPKRWIQLIVMQHINLFKKEDHGELVKIVKDRCNPSLFSYIGISGSRFL
jgi:hypothetical protein